MKKWGKWGVYLAATALMLLSIGYLIFSYVNENKANGSDRPDGFHDSDTENGDSDIEDQKNTDHDDAGQPVTLIGEDEAIDITHDLLTGLIETFGRLGEEHKWSSIQDDWEQPGYTEPDFEAAKPDLLNYATEKFAENTLKDILMDYYCF